MWEWFTELSAVEKVFLFCVGIGGVLFLLRVGLMFVGVGETDTDIDMDMDIDADADLDVGAHVDAEVHDAGDVGSSDFSFKILSFQGLTAFFTMFGLVGLAMMRNSGLTAAWAILGGTVAGLLSVWAISWLFSLFKKMQHSGTMNLRNAISQEGKIYLTVPAGEPGKVEVRFQGRQAILAAVSEDKSEIPTDSRVKVVDVVSGNILVVKKL